MPRLRLNWLHFARTADARLADAGLPAAQRGLLFLLAGLTGGYLAVLCAAYLGRMI